MKKNIATIISVLLFTTGFSQKNYVSKESVNYKLDYTNPISVVNGFIFASKNKDLKLNFLVFDPFIESGEFYKYRMVYFTKDLKSIEELYDMRNSFINGTPKISEDGFKATVPLWSKSSFREYQEEIKLINRFGNWYISGF